MLFKKGGVGDVFGGLLSRRLYIFEGSPVEGRRYEAFILNTSGLLALLQQLVMLNGEPFVLYGDPAYGLTQNILAPFRGAQLTANERAFNMEMSKVRISVE